MKWSHRGFSEGFEWHPIGKNWGFRHLGFKETLVAKGNNWPFARFEYIALIKIMNEMKVTSNSKSKYLVDGFNTQVLIA